jgi:hypothetical protein
MRHPPLPPHFRSAIACLAVAALAAGARACASTSVPARGASPDAEASPATERGTS